MPGVRTGDEGAVWHLGGPDRARAQGPSPGPRQLVGQPPPGRVIAVLAKLATRVRARGVREVVGLGVARVREAISSTETLVVLVRDTTDGEEPGRPDSLHFRSLTPGDAPLYARDIGTDSVTTFRSRLSESTSCYAVESDGRLLHASWVTTRCAWTRELRSFLCVGRGDAYVYESFTRDDARGRGVYPLALRGICKALATGGIGRLWVAVEGHNEASLKAVAKAGFERETTIRYGRRLGRLTLVLPDGVKTDTSANRTTKKRSIWLSRDGAM